MQAVTIFMVLTTMSCIRLCYVLFQPFFRPGNLLELGSYKGEFTRRFLDVFDDVSCVEASEVAIAEARKSLGRTATYFHAPFETVSLPGRYDNIVLTHVLEHLDDPIAVLKRINQEWLAEGGRLFLACPDANAPSRQIAVKMGLISHNAAVTPAEADMDTAAPIHSIRWNAMPWQPD